MRNTLENKNYKIAYGIDRIEGYFLEVLDKKDGNGVCFVRGRSSKTIEEIVAMAEEYGFDLSFELDDGSGYEGSGCGGGCETCARLGI